jgi:hypothetical protein
LSRRVSALEAEHQAKRDSLRKELEGQKLAPEEIQDRLAAAAREQQQELEGLKKDGERGFRRQAKEHFEAHLERELARRREEMKSEGLSHSEIEGRLAKVKEEVTARFRRKDMVPDGERGRDRGPDGEGQGRGARGVRDGEPMRRAFEEFQKMKRRVDELEQTILELKRALEALRAERSARQSEGASRREF